MYDKRTLKEIGGSIGKPRRLFVADKARVCGLGQKQHAGAWQEALSVFEQWSPKREKPCFSSIGIPEAAQHGIGKTATG